MDDIAMQITKIVSGGQTGADRAALDFAIEYDMDHGGWMPEGRMAEDGPIPDRYGLIELSGGGYARRTEKNVEDSDGTLIVSRGPLSGGSLLTFEVAQKHGRPCVHVDLETVIVFDAAIDVYEWLRGHEVHVLNVAGPRASKDESIYELTWNLLEMVLHMDAISGAMPNAAEFFPGRENAADSDNQLPASVDEAVNLLLERLSAKTKSRVASRPGDDLAGLKDILGEPILEEFGLDAGNSALLESCRQQAEKPDLEASGAVRVILRKLWERLRQMGHLRVVK
jgi:hypothetical protein